MGLIKIPPIPWSENYLSTLQAVNLMEATFPDGKRISMSSISLKMIICPYWLIGPNKLNAHTTTNWSSNCLEFIDLKAQICIPDLSPNLLYHLPTLYHFLVDHLKNSHDPEHPEHTDLWNIPKYLPAGDKDNSNLHYLSPDHEHHSAKDGTPTFQYSKSPDRYIFLCLLSTSFICYIYIFFGSNSVHMPLDLMDEMGTKQRIQLKNVHARRKEDEIEDWFR